MEIRTSEFTCKRGELNIRGTRFDPENATGAAIICHGFMGIRQPLETHARALAGAGYATFTFDFCGGGIGSESDGDTREMTVFTEREDLIAVMDYVRRQTGREKLVLMGCSQGGAVCALTAAVVPEQVEKLVLFYPALCIPDDARRGQMLMARFDPENIPEYFSCGPMELGRCYAASVIHEDFFPVIRKYRGPVHIVHGDVDRAVNISYSYKAKEAYGDNCSFTVLKNADHGFQGIQDEAAIYDTLQFLQGRTAILTVDVRLTGFVEEKNGEDSVVTLPFDGSVDGLFTGTILPGAADVQQWHLGKPVEMCATYTMKGRDYTGRECTVKVVNRGNSEGQWTPAVTTDSMALEVLNRGGCTAFLEHRQTGPVVRIYAEKP